MSVFSRSILESQSSKFQTHLHSPYKLWQYLYQLRDDKDWRNIFTLIELCMCSPCSNTALEGFFSQMHVVKTNWRNRLNKENLTHLLRIKVAGPPLREFHDTYRDLAISSWYSDKHQQMGQTPQKNTRKERVINLHEKNSICHLYLKQVAKAKTKTLKNYSNVSYMFLFHFFCYFLI